LSDQDPDSKNKEDHHQEKPKEMTAAQKERHKNDGMMIKQDDLLKMVLEKENWEEVLYQIVSLENIDPWNVDLIKLTEGFLKFIRNAQNLDFRVPAKIVFVASILLKLKSDYLSIFDEHSAMEEALAKDKPFIDLGIDPNLVKLGVPIKRMPKRQVTLDELVFALKKALDVRDRKVERVQRIHTRLRQELRAEEDIIKRIDKVMNEIETRMKKDGMVDKDGKLNFRELVARWEASEIVDHFMPILHLEKSQKITTEQEELFKEIFIKAHKDATEEEKAAAERDNQRIDEERRIFDEKHRKELERQREKDRAKREKAVGKGKGKGNENKEAAAK
jgi:segregation and condensation protein A